MIFISFVPTLPAIIQNTCLNLSVNPDTASKVKKEIEEVTSSNQGDIVQMTEKL